MTDNPTPAIPAAWWEAALKRERTHYRASQPGASVHDADEYSSRVIALAWEALSDGRERSFTDEAAFLRWVRTIGNENRTMARTAEYARSLIHVPSGGNRNRHRAAADRALLPQVSMDVPSEGEDGEALTWEERPAPRKTQRSAKPWEHWPRSLDDPYGERNEHRWRHGWKYCNPEARGCGHVHPANLPCHLVPKKLAS